MYVCVCNAVTDRHIRKAVDEGHTSFSQVQAALGVATCCGSCEDCARELLRGIAAERSAATASPIELVPVAA